MGSKGEVTDYERALQAVATLPKVHLGAEVETTDGVGIVVGLKVCNNGLYIDPDKVDVVVWYSTQEARERSNGWVTRNYRLNEVRVCGAKI